MRKVFIITAKERKDQIKKLERKIEEQIEQTDGLIGRDGWLGILHVDFPRDIVDLVVEKLKKSGVNVTAPKTGFYSSVILIKKPF